MGMYVLHVLSGEEENIAKKLGYNGFRAIVPSELRMERKGGKCSYIRRLLMPGYVFADVVLSEEIYYKMTALPGVIKMLNYGDPLGEDDVRIINNYADSDLTRLPHIVILRDGSKAIPSGMWQGWESRIVSLQPRQRRVTFRLDGINQLITVSCEVSHEG